MKTIVLVLLIGWIQQRYFVSGRSVLNVVSNQDILSTTDSNDERVCRLDGIDCTDVQNDNVDDKDNEEMYDKEEEYDDEEYYDDIEEFDDRVEAVYQAGSPAPIQGDRYGSDMGEAQVVDVDVGGDTDNKITQRIIDARRYMIETVHVDESYSHVRDTCRNHHAQCTFWAVSGECDVNPAYMHINCAPVCFTCEKLHVETRCPLNPNEPSAFEQPGDVTRMFERIITDPYYKQYNPTVVSRPSLVPGDTPANATYKYDGIWMVTFDNIITDTEADRLIELGGLLGYERSSDVGAAKADGTYDKKINSGRTSTNAWCVNDCYEDPLAVAVMDRIANITGIPEVNSENLQLLRYEKGQYYNTHNDYIPYQLKRQCGVRILTFYIYLNTVEEGGGTNFPQLGLTVQPKRGRAVLWPSIYDQNPNAKDPRSDHQALPVIKGVKFGANAWIHQRDFKTPNKNGCS